MIIEIAKEHQETIDAITALIASKDCRPDILLGDLYTVIAIEGDATQFDPEFFEAFPGVTRAFRITSPYKSIARHFIGADHQKITRGSTRVSIPGPDGLVRQIGGERYTFIAGPCTVESLEQLQVIAEGLARLADRYGIRDRLLLRGGAFKPRTRPGDFRGLGFTALDHLDQVRQLTGLPYVTEVMAVNQIDEMAERADMLQIGTRNYQNFDLLEAVGRARKPVLYKRGVAAPLEEWLSATEYIVNQGNKQVVLCERGVKSTTHGDYNRTHLDLDVIRAVKERTILPIIIDPSHASGVAGLVPYQFAGAGVFGADGTMVEVIADGTARQTILCDGKQGVRLSVYEKMIRYHLALEKIATDFQE